MEISEIPFNKVLGLSADDQAVVLQPQSIHQNHVGSIHAAVIFALAESAAGHFLLSRFPDMADSYVVVLRGTTTKYRQPATVGSELRAMANSDESVTSTFLETLRSRGRATLDLSVTVTQQETRVFTGTFTWFAARK